MLTSQLGIRLILWMGKAVPLPAPLFVSEALQSVQVSNDAKGGDGFQITFHLTKEAGLEYNFLASGICDPMTRVIIGVAMGVLPEPLIDGVVTHHELTPSNEPGQSTLTITGRDVSAAMDLEEKSAAYPNQPDFIIVNRLLLSYARYGIVPMVTPTSNVPIEVNRIPWQRETDLQAIQRMASDNSYVFYVEPLAFGINRAYFGPQPRAGMLQSALNVNLGPFTNVSSLNFTMDALAPVGTSGTFIDPIFGLTLPIPTLPSLKVPPLGLRPVTPLRTVRMRDTSKQLPNEAGTAALAQSMNAADAIAGNGTLDSVRYGSVLRARRLVGVRGAGISYDGLYLVNRVMHSITRGKYTQSFSLSREATVSSVPAVLP